MLIFLTLAGIGLFFLIVSAFFGHHVDFHADIDAGGMGFMSVRAVAVFLTAFGTVGAIAKHLGQSTGAASFWGIVSGVAMMAVYLLSMGLVKSQQASSLISDSDLIGHTGRVTVAIPAEGFGEVSCNVKGQTTRRMARSATHTPIAEGEVVKISECQGDVFTVEALNKVQTV